MKMDTMNISLPSAMSEFVRESTGRDYGNVSEFFRDLVRERIRREVESDLATLDSAMKDAPAGPTEAELQDILKTQRQVRKEQARARRS